MRAFVFTMVLGAVCLPVWAVDAAGASDPSVNPQEIIQKFAAKEAEFRKARENYTYKQSVKLEELDGSGNVQGKWEIVSDITYQAREKLDEIGTYKFSVKPKKMAQGKRYFEGDIWVDDRDLQIVKTFGKGVGVIKHSGDNQFPRFETYREQVDGKYWFPTYTRADDTLHFKSGQDQRIRMIVKYQDYKRYQGKSTITFGGVVDDSNQTPQAAPKK